MKAILLGAGYATRLYPLTREKPKPLLPVGGIPIIQRIMGRILSVKDLDGIYIVTNHRFFSNYNSWLSEYKPQKKLPDIRIFDDGSISPDDRLGAIGDIQFVIKNAKIKDDLLVVAGDNIIEFDVTPFINFAHKNGSTVGLKDLKKSELISKYGAVTIDSRNKIIDFEEKPPQPKTTLISIGLYYFLKKHLSLMDDYVKSGHNPDAPGYYVQWLHKQIDLYGYVIDGPWFDIGDIDSYNDANRMFA